MVLLFYLLFHEYVKFFLIKGEKMRPPRLIINEEQFGIYHLISRIVDSSFRLDDIEKTTFENDRL